MFSPIKVTSVGVDSDATANVRKRDFVRNNLVFKLFCLIVIVHEMYCALTSLSVFRWGGGYMFKKTDMLSRKRTSVKTVNRVSGPWCDAKRNTLTILVSPLQVN